MLTQYAFRSFLIPLRAAGVSPIASSQVEAGVPPLRSLVPRALRYGMTGGVCEEGRKGGDESYVVDVGGARPTNIYHKTFITLSDTAVVIP
ncbi:MAG: hypothetical protein LBH84_03920 [Prevotellaceae bacterium]|nr:hypothetical protein [Prevotellaceae bacterium]